MSKYSPAPGATIAFELWPLSRETQATASLDESKRGKIYHKQSLKFTGNFKTESYRGKATVLITRSPYTGDPSTLSGGVEVTELDEQKVRTYSWLRPYYACADIQLSLRYPLFDELAAHFKPDIKVSFGLKAKIDSFAVRVSKNTALIDGYLYETGLSFPSQEIVVDRKPYVASDFIFESGIQREKEIPSNIVQQFFPAHLWREPLWFSYFRFCRDDEFGQFDRALRSMLMVVARERKPSDVLDVDWDGYLRERANAVGEWLYKFSEALRSPDKEIWILDFGESWDTFKKIHSPRDDFTKWVSQQPLDKKLTYKKARASLWKKHPIPDDERQWMLDNLYRFNESRLDECAADIVEGRVPFEKTIASSVISAQIFITTLHYWRALYASKNKNLILGLDFSLPRPMNLTSRNLFFKPLFKYYVKAGWGLAWRALVATGAFELSEHDPAVFWIVFFSLCFLWKAEEIIKRSRPVVGKDALGRRAALCAEVYDLMRESKSNKLILDKLYAAELEGARWPGSVVPLMELLAKQGGNFPMPD